MSGFFYLFDLCVSCPNSQIISSHTPRTALGLTLAVVILCSLISLLLFLAVGALLMIIPAFMLGGFIIVATAGCLTGPALLRPRDG